MILSKRMADHRPHDMICELVDNALDADAKRVWIELGRRSISVSDDGAGMQDINDAIRFGKGTKMDRRGGILGRYGVGMTDALCKLGPRAEITTLHAGGLRRLRVDWEQCLREGHFPYLDESRPRKTRGLVATDSVQVETGTRVAIHGQSPGVHLEKLRRLLTERYTPGIWQGRELFLRREGQDWLVIEDMDPGDLVDVIEYDGEVEGLSYHVYGGLMTRRNVVYNRAFIGYAYRFIEDTTELFKGVSTAHLQVFLDDAWKECLGTHKNRIEQHREALFEDIRSRAKDWLVAAAQKSEALQLTNLGLELEDYLARMARSRGKDSVVPSMLPRKGRDKAAKDRKPRPSESQGEASDDATAARPRGIAIAWDPALRQMGELRVSEDGEVAVALNPEDGRICALRERHDCPGLVHIISAYVAQFAALSEENARCVLRRGIVAGAEPGYRPHELYAYYYDRVDQPAVAHESD